MQFNSLEFLIFFPVVLAVNYILPKKVRYLWLLLASYFFYMCWNAKYALLLLFSTAVTYVCARLLERTSGNRKKGVLFLSFLLNLGVLAVFKYTPFFLHIVTALFMRLGIELQVPRFDILLPVGISFYTFQALGYTMDVYRGDVKAEKNFFAYALFVSFFPQLVAGPIERSGHLLGQLAEPKDFDFDKALRGLYLMFWGYFLKMVVGDRIALYVDATYGNVDGASGWHLIIASVLFAIQIYCDFGGYSTIAVGASAFLGIELMENFDAPYLSASVGNFWRRWHISLTGWFKDYLYIPLGGSRKGKMRKFLNKMIVFLVSGLWHGAGFTYLFWGGLNGLYQIAEEIAAPLLDKFKGRFSTFLKGVATFALVDFAWVFFRATSLREALVIIKKMLHAASMDSIRGGALYEYGLDKANFILLFVCILILLAVDICKRRRIVIRDRICALPLPLQSFVIVGIVCFILVFGIWGASYEEASFIYFQF